MHLVASLNTQSPSALAFQMVQRNFPTAKTRTLFLIILYYIVKAVHIQMGNNFSSSLLAQHSISPHPIYGEVQVYYIKGEACKFIMKVPSKVSRQQLQLYELVGSIKNQALIRFYGCDKNEIINKVISNQAQGNKNFNNITNQNQDLKQKKSEKESKQMDIYWEYFNWDLRRQIEYLKSKGQSIGEQMIWQILDVGLKAAQYLQTFQVYPEFRPYKIQFAEGKRAKFYWGDILPKNMHRAYNVCIKTGQFRQTIYSPEQLLQILVSRRSQLKTEKCVVFGLGLTVLEAIVKRDAKYAFNYQTKKLNEAKKMEMLDMAKENCTRQLHGLLGKLLEYMPGNRYGYHDLEVKLDQHYKRNLHEPLEINIETRTEEKKDEQKSERTEMTQKPKTVEEMALKRPKSKSVMGKFKHLC